MAKKSDFSPSVALPPALDAAAIRRAIEYIEGELEAFVEICFEQANVFSALVGIFGTKALDTYSNYEKRRHVDIAQQRFPDLHRRGSGPFPKPNESLESKGSKRPWAIQSHCDHPGWYIVWRYMIDPTGTIERGKPVIIWRVDVVFLEKPDWKYEKSRAGAAAGGEPTRSGSRIRRTSCAAKLSTIAATSCCDQVSRCLLTPAKADPLRRSWATRRLHWAPRSPSPPPR